MAENGSGARSQTALMQDPRAQSLDLSGHPIEERLRQVVEYAPNAVLLVDQNGVIDLVNTEAERVFGYVRAEMLGRTVDMLLPQRFRADHPGQRAAFFRVGKPRPMGARRDLFALKKDGTEFQAEIGLNPIETESGAMVVVVAVDISERKQAEREHERQVEELRRSNAELAQFAHIASHDLKAPLRAIQNLAAWIIEDLGPGASTETRENLVLLRRRGERMEKLLSGLMEYALVGRSESGPERVDTTELVLGIVEYLAPPPGFSISCRAPMPVLRTNKIALEHVLMNLVGNALKHHDRAGGSVAIAARDLDDKVEFSVQDDGPGIASVHHDRIFVVFQTLRSQDEVEGAGIGLAIVKKIVEVQGGSIHVESEPPQRGATFIFTWSKMMA